jgi:hypothetical protein
MKPLLTSAVRFNTKHPDLCPALCWKGRFTAVADDPTVPSTRDHLYWCVYTQTCLGPDSQPAEPHLCSRPERKCHRQARADFHET